MKALLAAVLFTSFAALAADPVIVDGMYTHSFGDPKKQPVIFVHGGPGFDSWTFEETSAQKMADQGFYVVVYDRRGEGRSENGTNDYNFKTAVKDLKLVADTLKLKSPVIIGHSFGGPIVERFEEAYPGFAKKIVIVSGTINDWAVTHSTFENCERFLKDDPKALVTLHQVYDELFKYEHACVKPKSANDNDSCCSPTKAEGQPLQDAEAKNIKGVIEKSCVPALPPLALVEKAGDYESTCQVYKAFPGPGSDQAEALLAAHPLQGAKPHGDAEAGYYQDPDSYLRVNALAYTTAHRDRFCGIFGDHDGLFTPGAIKQIAASFKTVTVPSGHNVFLDQNDNFTKIVRSTCGI